MANTRTSAKRARQADRRQSRNQAVRGITRSTLKSAVDAIKAKDLSKAKVAFHEAIRIVSKAASKGAIPHGRAARKISRLTLLAKKTLPELVPGSKS